MSRKKTYILDTNVYLTDFNSIYAFKNNDIVVPFKVLEEIDNHKKRQDAVGSNARQTIRIFDDLRTKGSLQNGVRLGKGKGILYVRGMRNHYSQMNLMKLAQIIKSSQQPLVNKREM